MGGGGWGAKIFGKRFMCIFQKKCALYRSATVILNKREL